MTRADISRPADQARELADVDAPDRFVRQENEHLTLGWAPTGQIVSEPLPAESEVDRLRRQVAESGQRPHRGRPLASTQRIAQLMLGPYAHKGGFVLPGSAQSSQRIIGIGSTGQALGRGGEADMVTLTVQQQPHETVGQETPGLIPPSLRRALNEAEVAAQRAARVKRSTAAAAVRSGALLAHRHPHGILLPTASSTGNTRELASAAVSGDGPRAASAAPPLGVYAAQADKEGARRAAMMSRGAQRRAMLMDKDHGETRRGFNILRPHTSAGPEGAGGGAGAPSVGPRSASAQGRPIHASQEGDTFSMLSHRRRLQPWVSNADLALGETTRQRLFEQPANPPPSAARRQRLIDLNTAGRKHDLLTGLPLSRHRCPEADEKVSLRQAHPSMSLSQVFTAK